MWVCTNTCEEIFIFCFFVNRKRSPMNLFSFVKMLQKSLVRHWWEQNFFWQACRLPSKSTIRRRIPLVNVPYLMEKEVFTIPELSSEHSQCCLAWLGCDGSRCPRLLEFILGKHGTLILFLKLTCIAVTLKRLFNHMILSWVYQFFNTDTEHWYRYMNKLSKYVWPVADDPTFSTTKKKIYLLLGWPSGDQFFWCQIST